MQQPLFVPKENQKEEEEEEEEEEEKKAGEILAKLIRSISQR
jgi:hypothetical protein